MPEALYVYESNFPAAVEDLFAYHENPVALQRLIPPWENCTILDKSGGIENGGKVTLQLRFGPLKAQWVSRHESFERNRQFSDIQVKGPFSSWKHTHAFRSTGQHTSTLKELIQFKIPLGSLGHHLAYSGIRKRLNRMFTYRHAVTQNDLNHLGTYRRHSKSRVVITGGNGLIGSELAVFLKLQGHEVKILSRSGRSRVFGIPGVRWNPDDGFIDRAALGNVDCWVHLAGENLSEGRWTDKRIQALKDSRVKVTQFLVDFLGQEENPPHTFISASGTGFYESGEGDRTESSRLGRGVLAEICDAWESASEKLEELGVRRVILRTGVVLSQKGGALAKMLPIFKLGIGGPLGKGDQYWSWIAMDDLVRIYDAAIQDSQFVGIYNAVAPSAVTNRKFSKTLGSVLHRPVVMPVPKVALKTLIGPMAEEALFASHKVIPDRLQREQKFEFLFPKLGSALSHCLGVY